MVGWNLSWEWMKVFGDNFIHHINSLIHARLQYYAT